MNARLLAPLWIVSFAAALMPFAAFEMHSVLLAVTVLATGFSFVVLKTDFPSIAAPVNVAFLTPVFAFLAVAFLSVVNSQIPYTSFIFFCFFALFPISLLCGIVVQEKPHFFASIAAGLYLIFAALSGVTLLQFFAVPEALFYGRVHWPFADPNSLGGLMALGFFFGFGLMTGGRNRADHNLGLVLAILTAGALLTTGSRGALIGGLAGLFVLVALAMPQMRKHGRCILIFVLAMGAMFWAVHWAAPAAGDDAGQRIISTLRGEVPALWSRPAIWEATHKIVDSHFWTGTGIGTFYLYYPEVRLAADSHSAGRMAHNDPLQFWAEMGVFAPILFYVFIVLAIVMTIRSLMILAPEDDRRVRILTPFCGLFALVLHTHITFHFYSLPLLMLMGVMTGFWFWQVREVAGERLGRVPSLKLPQGEVFKALTVGPLLLGTFAFAMLQSSQIMTARAEARLMAGDMPGFVHDANASDRMALGKNEQAHLLAAKVSLATLQAMGGIPDPGADELYESGLRQLGVAHGLNPQNPVTFYLEAEYDRSAALLGLQKKNNTEQLLIASLRLNPAFFTPRVALAQLYVRQKKNAEAYDVLKAGVPWRFAAPVPPEYYELLARLALEAGDADMRDTALKGLLKTRGKKPEKDEKDQ